MEQQEYCFEEKTLTPTDKGGKLMVPSAWLGDHLLPIPNPGMSREIPSIDEFGKEYTFLLKARPPTPGETYYMKPEFMFRGWHAFVVDKQLKVGEKIYVWKDNGYFRIKVRVPPQPFNIFGQIVLV